MEKIGKSLTLQDQFKLLNLPEDFKTKVLALQAEQAMTSKVNKATGVKRTVTRKKKANPWD